jgi:hypothetical protein
MGGVVVAPKSYFDMKTIIIIQFFLVESKLESLVWGGVVVTHKSYFDMTTIIIIQLFWFESKFGHLV